MSKRELKDKAVEGSYLELLAAAREGLRRAALARLGEGASFADRERSFLEADDGLRRLLVQEEPDQAKGPYKEGVASARNHPGRRPT